MPTTNDSSNEDVGSNFLRALVNQSKGNRLIAAALLVVAVIVLVVLEVTDFALYETHEEYVYSLVYALFVCAVFFPIYRLAMLGDRAIHHVVVWSLLSMLATLTFLYAMYFAVTSNLAIDPNQPVVNGIAPKIDEAKLSSIRSQANLFLTIPPVILGVWAAITGLFVNYQTAKKNQRTSNAFALVMQTRTSSLYTEAALARQSAYPVDHTISIRDEAAYVAAKRVVELPGLKQKYAYLTKRIEDTNTQLESPGVKDEPALRALLNSYQTEFDKTQTTKLKIEGFAGIRYLLNYYEFMAKGVRIGDLDEEILVGTLRATVVSAYDDAKEFREYIQNANANPNSPLPLKPAQPKAYEHLRWLVEGDETRPVGWNKK